MERGSYLEPRATEQRTLYPATPLGLPIPFFAYFYTSFILGEEKLWNNNLKNIGYPSVSYFPGYNHLFASLKAKVAIRDNKYPHNTQIITVWSLFLGYRLHCIALKLKDNNALTPADVKLQISPKALPCPIYHLHLNHLCTPRVALISYFFNKRRAH